MGNLSVNQELLNNIPTLEVLYRETKKHYIVRDIYNNEITLENIKDNLDEWYINLKNISPDCEIGKVLNYDKFIKAVRNVMLEQEINEYQQH